MKGNNNTFFMNYVFQITQCVRYSMFDGGRVTFFTGERTLASFKVRLQLVFHFQIGL